MRTGATVGWTLFAILAALVVVLTSTVVKFWPEHYFWVERDNAQMPVWVRGNTASGIFVVFNHGGPGSCGTAESIFEVNPGDGRFDHVSPVQALESNASVVYWDQRHSGMSSGSADPNDSRIEDFGNDLALVITELRKRYRVKHLFLIGQSWGHAVALSYLTLVDGWQDNQARVDGYIIYKGNNEQNSAYLAARPRIIQFADAAIAAGRDVAYWNTARAFLKQHDALSDPADFSALDEYSDRAMQVSGSLASRVWASLRASIFSPLNGWSIYFNNRRTMHAGQFLKRVVNDRSLSETLPRLSIPVLLIYGARDLHAPVEVGREIYERISTPKTRKTLLVLPNSRHGAEGDDVRLFQTAVESFIERQVGSHPVSARGQANLERSDFAQGKNAGDQA